MGKCAFAGQLVYHEIGLILLPLGTSPGDHYDIALFHSFLRRLQKQHSVIFEHRTFRHLKAHLPGRRIDPIRVDIPHLAWLWRLPRRHQFISRGYHRDLPGTVCTNPGDSKRCQGSDRLGRDLRPFFQNLLSLFHVISGFYNISPRCHRLIDCRFRIREQLAELHHYDSIRTFRNHAASRDIDAGSGRDFHLWRTAHLHLPHDP